MPRENKEQATEKKTIETKGNTKDAQRTSKGSAKENTNKGNGNTEETNKRKGIIKFQRTNTEQTKET